MNTKYKVLLVESKKLNGSGLLQRASANNITADKILYEYAIQMVRMPPFIQCPTFKHILTVLSHTRIFFFCFQCQSAALDELFGKPSVCFPRYQTAQILFHSLAQQTEHPQDKNILGKCMYF